MFRSDPNPMSHEYDTTIDHNAHVKNAAYLAQEMKCNGGAETAMNGAREGARHC
jgi:hypothetical protein